MIDGFRVYTADELGADGYPLAWHGLGDGDKFALKHLVREQAGHRCVRCRHPFVVGETPGEWSPCDGRCTHGGPTRTDSDDYPGSGGPRYWVEARWRVLTVHHLDGVKANCRWWNLVALCQRCHLEIQGRVRLDRPWPWPHTDWMQPHVAGFYALKYLAEDLTREQTMARLDELLELGVAEESVERMAL